MTASTLDKPQPKTPPVRSGVAAYLTVDGAVRASEFYQRAFAAEQLACMPPDENGRTMHVHLEINGASVMLSDAYPEHGHPWREPAGFTLHLQVDDADAWFARAVEAGCTAVLPVQVMFWGDRYGQLRDPFGVSWSVGSSNV